MDDIKELLAEADALYVRYEFDAALELYRTVLTLDENQAWAHNRIGGILAQKGVLDEAEEALTRALELDPSLAAAHSNLGNVYYTRGNYHAALDRYREALKLEPENGIFHENLHAAYKKLGRVTEAVHHLKRSHAIKREQTKAEARVQLKGIKQKTGCFGTLLLVAAASLATVFIW
jgi:tetratricopeptide (TPR) repeat protein